MPTQKPLVVEFLDTAECCVLQSLYHQYKVGDHVDVTLCVDGRTLSVHSFLLAAESDLLKKQLLAKLSSSSHAFLDLSNVCDEFIHLETVVEYLYKRRVRLDMNNIRAILRLCQYCSFQRLMSHSKQFLLNRIQPLNCLEIWRTARAFGLPDIEKMALALVKEVFWDVCIKNESLKHIGNKEMAYLMDQVPFPRKVDGALEFLISWLNVNFSERSHDAQRYLSKFIPKKNVTNIIQFLDDKHGDHSRLLVFLNKVISQNISSNNTTTTISPFQPEDSWVIAVTERQSTALYFPTENRWTKLLLNERTEIFGILGNNVMFTDHDVDQIRMVNLENWRCKFLPTSPEVPNTFCRKYFCTNVGLHVVTCRRYGNGVKVIVGRYKYRWSRVTDTLYCSGATTIFMRVEPCPQNSNVMYMLISSRYTVEDSDADNSFFVLRYDSLTKRLQHVFSSTSWAPPVTSKVLFIGNSINIVEETTNDGLMDKLKSGSIEVHSLCGRDETKTVSLPMTVPQPVRPKSVEITRQMTNAMNHFGTAQFCSYSGQLFWLEQVSPSVTRISVYNTLDAGEWVELPPSPLLGLSPMELTVFGRNSELRGGFSTNNERN